MSSGEKFEATIDLGAVELSVDELLLLRKGAVIDLGRPQKLSGALRLNGFTWALVDIDVNEAHLTLTVRELSETPEKKVENVDPSRKLFNEISDDIKEGQI